MLKILNNAYQFVSVQFRLKTRPSALSIHDSRSLLLLLLFLPEHSHHCAL